MVSLGVTECANRLSSLCPSTHFIFRVDQISETQEEVTSTV
jgi:hypothetical protein